MTAPNSRPGFHRVYRPGAPKVYTLRDHAHYEITRPVPRWHVVLEVGTAVLAVVFFLLLMATGPK